MKRTEADVSDAKLMPCPWFGHGSLIGCEHLRAPICEDPVFCVQCSCGAVGPGSATPAGAIKNWNTRASDPAAQAVVEALENTAELLNVAMEKLGLCGEGDGKDRRADAEFAGGIDALKQARATLGIWREAHPKGAVKRETRVGRRMEQNPGAAKGEAAMKPEQIRQLQEPIGASFLHLQLFLLAREGVAQLAETNEKTQRLIGFWERHESLEIAIANERLHPATEVKPGKVSYPRDYVLSRYPEASCFETDTYWPGQGTHHQWLVTLKPYSSISFARGETEDQAWERAGYRLQFKEQQKRIAALEAQLTRIKDWCDAYPLDLFSEPDLQTVLAAFGSEQLTRLSAHILRRALNEIKEIIDGVSTGDAGTDKSA